MTRSSVDASLETLGRLSRAARARRRAVDMSPETVERRLRDVSQLRALCRYLMDMKPVPDAPPREG
jgi:hypothetical protein